MKKLSSVSIFNQNNIMLNDISDEQLKNSNLIIFLEHSGIKDKNYFFDKVNDYLLLNMVDLPITDAEFKEISNKNTNIETNTPMMYLIFPTSTHISSILNFICIPTGDSLLLNELILKSNHSFKNKINVSLLSWI